MIAAVQITLGLENLILASIPVILLLIGNWVSIRISIERLKVETQHTKEDVKEIKGDIKALKEKENV